MRRFVNTAVFGFLFTGVILVIIGETHYLSQLSKGLPFQINENSSLHTIIKSIGDALIGSGVFTAIIKSSEYSQVFSKIIGDIIWSKKFIEKRSDKREMWSMISRLMYQEKFPLISDEMENIITTEYFPTSHQYYIENYNVIVNITEHNHDFWKHDESITITLKPTSSSTKINFSFRSAIDLPLSGADCTSYVIEEFLVNGVREDIDPQNVEEITESKYLKHSLSVHLNGSDSYDLLLKRSKILCKITNPYKTFVSQSIIKNLSLTVMMKSGMDIGFHASGTVNKFIEGEDQVNNGVKVKTWSYKGVILPHQGFILIFKNF